MDKSPEAFRTISEVADFLDTPAHVLRFWESRFPQIRPVKRAGGRRYYRPADVALLAGIKKLLHDEGMTIRGVQKILREHGIRHVASLASGETGTVLDDADIEAVLSAEYGPRDRVTDSEPPSSDALQSAQIISLETALNRQDAARDAQSVQTELWPPADLTSPADDAGAVTWPGDPGDHIGSVEQVEQVEPVPIEETLSPQQPMADADVAQDLEPATAPPADDVISEDHPADVPQSSPETLAPGSVTVDDADHPAESDATGASGQEGASDSSSAAGQDLSEDTEPVQSATVAALLRRTSSEDVSAVQPQLIHLRDRLIDLRGRVAEAARRKAK
jgi:DNA-binding transcriptional MerR regulator